jgi:hypothetical protein
LFYANVRSLKTLLIKLDQDQLENDATIRLLKYIQTGFLPINTNSSCQAPYVLVQSCEKICILYKAVNKLFLLTSCLLVWPTAKTSLKTESTSNNQKFYHFSYEADLFETWPRDRQPIQTEIQLTNDMTER